jgi:hypothetical protein
MAIPQVRLYKKYSFNPIFEAFISSEFRRMEMFVLRSVDGNEDLADKIISKAYNTYASTNKTNKRAKKLPKISEAEDNAKLIEQARENHVIKASKNKYGNYEEPDTHFVFSNDQIVIGKQSENGIEKLTEEDVELCKSRFLSYDTACLE